MGTVSVLPRSRHCGTVHLCAQLQGKGAHRDGSCVSAPRQHKNRPRVLNIKNRRLFLETD